MQWVLQETKFIHFFGFKNTFYFMKWWHWKLFYCPFKAKQNVVNPTLATSQVFLNNFFVMCEIHKSVSHCSNGLWPAGLPACVWRRSRTPRPFVSCFFPLYHILFPVNTLCYSCCIGLLAIPLTLIASGPLAAFEMEFFLPRISLFPGLRGPASWEPLAQLNEL